MFDDEQREQSALGVVLVTWLKWKEGEKVKSWEGRQLKYWTAEGLNPRHTRRYGGNADRGRFG